MAKYMPAEARIAKWIEAVLVGGSCMGAAALETVGVEAIPAVLSALSDWRTKPSERNPDPEPLVGLCRVLCHHAPPEAVAILGPRLPRLRGNARKAVITLLFRVATKDAFDAIASALVDPDPKQRADVEYALWRAVREKHQNPDASLTAGVVGLLLDRLEEKHEFDFECLAETVLGIAPQVAMPRLINGPWFRVDHPECRQTLLALVKSRVPVPPESLLPLVPAAKSYDLERDVRCSNDSLYGNLLRALAYAAPTEAKPLAAEALSSGHPIWHSCGASAMAIIAGVQDAYSYVMRRAYEKSADGIETFNPKRLSQQQRNYIVAFDVDAEVCNGGFHQFFFNPSGRLARHAPAALRAIGATRAAGLAEAAIRAIGPKLLAAVETGYFNIEDATVCDTLHRLSDDYYARDVEPILDLLDIYAAANPSHFSGDTSSG